MLCSAQGYGLMLCGCMRVCVCFFCVCGGVGLLLHWCMLLFVWNHRGMVALCDCCVQILDEAFHPIHLVPGQIVCVMSAGASEGEFLV